MNTLIRKNSIIFLFPLLVTITSCNLFASRMAPFVITRIVMLGERLEPIVLAAFVENIIDRGFRALFESAADNTTNAIYGSIKPIGNGGLLGKCVKDPVYKVAGNHANGAIAHPITIPKEEITFQRANKLSQWDLTPDSRTLVAERLQCASAQVSLLKYGFKPGRVDGIIGPITIGEIKKFQQSKNLPVTGELDEPTKYYLLTNIDTN